MIEPTNEQKELLKRAIYWYKHSSEQVFEFSGSAGTGKSVMLHMIINSLGLSEDQIAPMSYTGSAAMVMRLKGFLNAKTMHSWLYKLETLNTYDSISHKVKVKKRFVFTPLNSTIIKLIIIDESSMIPLSHRANILKSGIKVIATGDICQLPPIADKPGFLRDISKIFILNQIMRQAQGSSIVQLSNMIKKGIQPKIGNYNQVIVVPKSYVNESMISSAEIIITGTNRTRDKLNNFVRHKLLNISSPYPRYMEKIVCRKNDWSKECDGISLVNGLTGTITNRPSVAGFKDGRFIINFKPDLFEDIEFKDLECDYLYMISDYNTRMKMKSLTNPNPKMNEYQKFEFAYAITAYLSQGSQYKNGIYISEYAGQNQTKLDYTGLTRFSNFCIYVVNDPKIYITIPKCVVNLNGVPVI